MGWRQVAVLGLGVAVVAGCASVLSSVDVQGLRDAAVLTSLGYRRQDAGTAGAALDRGAFCSVQGVMARQHLPMLDAGITCGPP